MIALYYVRGSNKMRWLLVLKAFNLISTLLRDSKVKLKSDDDELYAIVYHKSPAVDISLGCAVSPTKTLFRSLT